MSNMTIFGSCVSRDVFEWFPEQLQVQTYFARSSLVSVMSPKISIQEGQINLASAFQKRMVKYDLKRSFLDLNEDQVDYLLIDFIDERFDILYNKFSNQCVTRSVELVKSGLDQTVFKNYTRLSRNSDTVRQLWEDACLLFINKLKDILKPENVLLHKAFWAERYVDQGQILMFEEKKQQQIKIYNQLLEDYYSFFEKHFEGIRIIESKNQLLADHDHKWGLSPFHYHPAYYDEIGQQLLSLG